MILDFRRSNWNQVLNEVFYTGMRLLFDVQAVPLFHSKLRVRFDQQANIVLELQVISFRLD